SRGLLDFCTVPLESLRFPALNRAVRIFLIFSPTNFYCRAPSDALLVPVSNPPSRRRVHLPPERRLRRARRAIGMRDGALDLIELAFPWPELKKRDDSSSSPRRERRQAPPCRRHSIRLARGDRQRSRRLFDDHARRCAALPAANRAERCERAQGAFADHG